MVRTLADDESVLELREAFAPALVTALIRVEGRSFGLIANDTTHLGGAIDAEAGDKAARFFSLCDAHGLPIVSLCDTPGFMVGPDAERHATVRHVSRMFVRAANLRVPLLLVVLRKAYGLGAMAMAGGSTRSPAAAIAWPQAEFGGMGIEGAVRLGFRRELEAAGDDEARQALFDRLVEEAYERGKALNAAAVFEIDDVIDPADTRRWIVGGLKALPPVPPRTEKKLRWVDSW